MRDTGIKVEIKGIEFHMRAAALIIQDGKLLVAKHVDHPLYYTVGGVVEIGESTEQAVVREILEETGYILDCGRLAFVHERFPTFKGKKCHEMNFFYVIRPDSSFDVADGQGTDQVTETLHWLPLDKLGEYDLVPEFLKTASFDSAGITHIITKE